MLLGRTPSGQSLRYHVDGGAVSWRHEANFGMIRKLDQQNGFKLS